MLWRRRRYRCPCTMYGEPRPSPDVCNRHYVIPARKQLAVAMLWLAARGNYTTYDDLWNLDRATFLGVLRCATDACALPCMASSYSLKVRQLPWLSQAVAARARHSWQLCCQPEIVIPDFEKCLFHALTRICQLPGASKAHTWRPNTLLLAGKPV